MTILSVGLAYRTRVEVKLSGADAQRTKAYYLALGGIERARALLSLQKSPLVVPKSPFVAGFVMPRNGCQCYWNQLGTIDYWMDICGENFFRYNSRIYSNLKKTFKKSQISISQNQPFFH